MYFRQINILLFIIVELPCIFIPHRLSPNDFQMIQTYGSRQHKAVTIGGFRKHDATSKTTENGVEMASYFHIWMSPGHFHVVLDVASCYLNLSNIVIT